MAISNSFFRIFSTDKTPACPSDASPHKTGLPISTALAPSATAFIISVPLRIPPSSKISILPFTVSEISGRTSIVARLVSSCLPP